MTKKQKKTKSRKPNKIPKSLDKLAGVLDTSAVFHGGESPQPSPRAMGLAQMAMRLASDKPKRGQMIISPLDSIASAIDSTLRFDRAMAEVEGDSKGIEKAKKEASDAILNGIVARIQYQIENMVSRPETFTISAADALVVARQLERDGFYGYKRPPEKQQYRWEVQVRQATDGPQIAGREPIEPGAKRARD